ncbi:MAG: hypothetical protein R3A13_03245 [Bdellovibrionota bacterium]
MSTNESKSLKSQLKKTKTRNKSYIMDLRIHSPSSLGYLGIEGIETAPALVRLAKVKKLDLIAVTDVNSGGFIDKLQAAALDSSVTVIPGVVIRCAIEECEDVVLSCFFPEHYGTNEIEEFMSALEIPNAEFGNKDYRVNLKIERILEIAEATGGIVVPSRMDKTPSRKAAINVLINKYGFRAFDLAYADSKEFFKKNWPKIKFQLFSFSNAEALAQVGSKISKVKMSNPGFEGLREIAMRESEAI